MTTTAPEPEPRWDPFHKLRPQPPTPDTDTDTDTEESTP